jgi:hypothetical protein
MGYGGMKRPSSSIGSNDSGNNLFISIALCGSALSWKKSHL